MDVAFYVCIVTRGDNNNVALVYSYLLNSAFMNNFAISNSDLNKSGVPSSMRNMP